jgi:hypothetical protein
VISTRLLTTFLSPVIVPKRFGTSSFTTIMIRAPRRRTCYCPVPRELRTPPSVRPSPGTFGNAAMLSSSTQRMNRFRLLFAGVSKTFVFGYNAALPDPLYFPLCSASQSVMLSL